MMKREKPVWVVLGLLCFSILLLSCDELSQNAAGSRSQSAGIYGTVTDTAGEAVTNATVILVPSSGINTSRLDVTSFSPTATDDEPLEDLVNATNSYQSATTDSSGNYTFSAITAGTYFIYLKPASDDTGHLPGGSLCRVARQLTDVGLDLDIEVSTTPSSSATYVGSSICLTCHTTYDTIKKTGHSNSLRVPGTNSGLQNISAFENFDAALAKFDGTTKIYFYDYDGTRGFDKYKTKETSTGTVSFYVRLINDSGVYKMEFNNVKNTADPNNGITYNVDLTYGGAVYKQRYLTKMGTSYQVLPLQYQQEGSDSYTTRTRTIWRDYHAATSWYDETNTLFKTPAKSKAFDNNCAGCHMTGYALSGNGTDGWVASAVSDTNGTIDYDADGDMDEINTGCEVCHGPGSEHVAAAGDGRTIVQPGLITPEREAMICGRCHSRPKGALGTDVPDDANGGFMPPGHSRSEFLANYTNGTQYDGVPGTDLYGDMDEHSKSHHQQYTDFIRSSLYKNRDELMACSSCHNMHGTNNFRSLAATTSDNALCTTCHGDKSNITAHTEDQLGVSTDMGAICIDCHMPKMAKTGAGRPGNGNYWENDVTSHLFAVPLKSTSIVSGVAISDSLMPLPYTNSCGTCHDSDLSDD